MRLAAPLRQAQQVQSDPFIPHPGLPSSVKTVHVSRRPGRHRHALSLYTGAAAAAPGTIPAQTISVTTSSVTTSAS